MKKGIYFIIVVFVFSLVGCASIVSDSKYPVNISSSPKGAKLSVEDDSGRTIFTGRTPANVTLNASEGFFQAAEYTIICEKEGSYSRTTTLNSGLDGWYVGNILFGGLIGWLIVDPATGAMWKLDDNVHVNLEAKESASIEKSLHILTINQVPEDMRSKLVKIN